MTTESFQTPVAFLAFPALAEAKADKKGTLKYGCVLLIPKTTNIDALKNAALAARNAAWPDTKTHAGLKLGIKNGDTPNGNGNIPNGYAGHWVVNCGSKYRPLLVDEKVQAVLDIKGKFYPGCKVIGLVNVFTYSTDGNRGVSFGISGLQWVGDGPKLATSIDAAAAFSPVPGSAAAGNGDSLDQFASGSPAKAADPFG